ncbi:hypothetical protein Gpo141_00008365 [Globisporangium polare]
MNIWSRGYRCALVLSAVLSVSSLQWQEIYAKEICEDAGTTPAPVPSPQPVPSPAPTPLTTVPTPGAPAPSPSTPAVPIPAPSTSAPVPIPVPGPSSPTPTPVPSTTPGPATPTPPVPGPTPTTSAPVPPSPAPVTPAPSPAPSIPAPTTQTPVPTPDPTTQAPVPAPIPAPVPGPTTPTPSTVVPTPGTATPAPPAPTTPAPTTQVPATPAPTTPAPTTPAPTTPAPTTPAPNTPTPTTPTPTPTPAPTTSVPTPTPTSALGCGKQLKQIYFHGFDLEDLPLATPEECCAACNANPKCKLYTHFKSSTTGLVRCYLKTAAGEKTNYGDSKTVTAVSAYANLPPTPAPTTEAPTPTPSPQPLCGQQLKQIYYHGFDLAEFVYDTPEECCTECARDPKCALYTYFYSKTTGQKRCLLKTAAGEKTNYGDSQSVVAVSAFAIRAPTPAPTPAPVCTITNGQYCGNAGGVLCCDTSSYCQPWNNDYYQCIGLPDGCGQLETDVDYYGGDIKSVSNVYPWDCCRLCQETDGCLVYTFVNLDPSGPTCYLKSSDADKVTKIGALSGHRVNFSPMPTPEPTAANATAAPEPALR